MKNLWKMGFVLVTISSAFAQAEDKSTANDPAVQAFARGQALFEEGAYLEAAAAFDKAYRLRPHPLVIGNIGHCYDAAGDYPKAVEAFRKYLKQPSPGDPTFNKKISKRLTTLQSKVGDLRISCRETRCAVTVNNVPRGLAPVDLVVLVGVHRVEVADVDGATKRQYEVNVNGAGESLLDVDLTNPSTGDPTGVSSALSSPDEKEDPKPGHVRAAFWTAASTTLLGVGAITVLGILNLENQDDFQKGGATDVGLRERGHNLNLATNIAIGVTCAAATTALVLGIISRKGSSQAPKEQRKVVLLPTISPAPASGALVGMSFLFP